MLKKIMALFRSEKQEEVVLSIEDLGSEFKMKRAGYHETVVLPRFDSIAVRIVDLKGEVEELSSILEKAVLKNQKIAIRERQFMEGNRESYVKHARILMRFEMPKDYDGIQKGYADFMKSLEVFGAQTFRPKQILSHFFDHETEAVHLAIYKIKKEFDKFLSLGEDSMVKTMRRVESALHKYSNLMAKREELNHALLSEKRVISELKAELDSLTVQLRHVADSEEYKSFGVMVEKRKLMESAMRQRDESIVEIFSPVMRAMKKYERSAMDGRDCLVALVDSPRKTLISFDPGQILDVLDNLKLSIESGRLSFNDEKEKGKVLKGISVLMGGDLIASLKKDLVERISALNSVEFSISDNSSKSRLDSLEEKRFIVDKKLSDHISAQSVIKKEFDSLDENSLKSEIARDYGIIIQKRVKII